MMIMTDEEKMLIKMEIYKAYKELPTCITEDRKFVISVKNGLERIQRKFNEKEKNNKNNKEKE